MDERIPRAGRMPDLSARQREILRIVIREYISSAEPVASVALVRRYALEVSPATVRNELAALEELGLLTHPHTSAGRVPTELGYRFFIDSLMPGGGLAPEERLTVSHQFQQARQDNNQWLRLAASTLARLTTEASIVTSSAARASRVRHLEAVPIGERRVLLVAVLEGGDVLQQLLELPAPAEVDELRALSARLRSRVGGRDARGVRRVLAAETSNTASVLRALTAMLEGRDHARARDIYYDGVQNIMAQPEFAQTGRIREMFELLEDRTRLAGVLPSALASGDVHVAIGHEHRLESLRGCSLVFGSYGGGSAVIGYVGVVGPTRMDYARSIGAVRFIGGLMSDLVRAVEGQ